MQVAAEKGSFVDTDGRVRKDGTTLWANVTITALRDESVRLVGYASSPAIDQSKRVEAVELASRER